MLRFAQCIQSLTIRISNNLKIGPVQESYFDRAFLLRRLDYTVDVAVEEKNTFNVAQYVYDHKEVQKLKIPSTRRMYKRDENGRPIMDDLMIWIDLSVIKFT